jgi:hypothetical protein
MGQVMWIMDSGGRDECSTDYNIVADLQKIYYVENLNLDS